MDKRNIIKKLISILWASLCYYAVCKIGTLYSYNILSWILYGVLVIAFLKTNLFDNRYWKTNIILTVIMSIILAYGRVAYLYMNDYSINILKEFISYESLKYLIIYSGLLYMLLSNIMPILLNINIVNKNNKQTNYKKLFLICMIAIFICYLPYLLCYYPGTLSPDSIGELTTVVNKFSSVSDHHPVIHMLFMGIFYNIGYLITNNMTHAVAFISVAQMLIMSSIFAYVIVFLKKRNINNFILLGVFAFYAILPMHGYYSITMWKDVLFAGMFTLLTTQTIKILEKENDNKITIRDAFVYGLISLLCVFFRNNAIYMYAIFILISFILLRKNRKIILSTSLIVVALFVIIKGPIFNMLNIRKSASAEYIGMPLQQIARIVTKNGEISEEEKEKINKLIPIDIIPSSYNPVVSDGIKFNTEYKNEVFDSDKLGYLKLWLSLIIKNPEIAFEAYSISTLGYYYPGVEYWSVSNTIWENEYNIENINLLSQPIKSLIEKMEQRGTPILSIEWSIGLCVWSIAIFSIICKKRNGFKSIYPYIPALGIWLTMMLASPVFGEFRYVYCLFTTLPLFFLLPYLNGIKSEFNTKIKHGKITIKDITKKNGQIRVNYKISKNLKKFFNEDNNFTVEYHENIEKIPNSIAVIPFVSNVLPIIWLTNSKLIIEELDEEYYNSIPNTRDAFNKMYKTNIFKGKVVVNKLVKNKPLKGTKNISVFCSGGVDSTLSLKEALNVSKKPLLITIWGTDVWETDTDGWKTLEKYSSEVGKNLKLKNLFIKTNFRKFIYEHELTKCLLSGKIDDSWWRGIQHGIGLIGHVAPLAYLYNINAHFIPATLNNKNTGSTCGSFPTIDESVKYCGCKIIHSGYEYTRLEKVREIINYFKSDEVKLRVCYQEKGTMLNCCHCEKCYLTIMEIIAIGENPREWGFEISDDEISQIPLFLKKHASNSPINIEIWDDIIKNSYNIKNKILKNKNYKWILDYRNQRDEKEYKIWKNENLK